MDLAEKERARLAKQRMRQKRYTDRANKPHPVPVHMTWEMRERLDYLVAVHKTPGGTSGFMRQAFEFYAAHLLGTASPAEVASPAESPDPPQVEPPPPVEALEVPTVEVAPQAEEETKVDPAPEVKEEPRIDPPEIRIDIAVETPPEPTEPPYRWRYDPNDPSTWVPPKAKARSRKEKIAKTLIDAEKRVPVRIEFTRKHHHIPWGMRHIMWDNGLQHRGNVWRGRLMPERAERMAEEVAKFGGTLEVTGGLGEAPKWAPGEYRGDGRSAKEKAPA